MVQHLSKIDFTLVPDYSHNQCTTCMGRILSVILLIFWIPFLFLGDSTSFTEEDALPNAFQNDFYFSREVLGAIVDPKSKESQQPHVVFSWHFIRLCAFGVYIQLYYSLAIIHLHVVLLISICATTSMV
jgi:hypothetical protein